MIDLPLNNMNEYRSKVLIVEDNIAWCESFKKWIGDTYEKKLAFNRTDALSLCESFEPDLIILDLGLPKIEDGLSLLDDLVKQGRDYQIIVVTSAKDHQYALEAQRRGAYSYFSKSEKIDEELPFLIKQAAKMQQLQRENIILHSRLKNYLHFDNIVAVSKQMQDTLQFIDNIRKSSEPILIQGESGVGKEVIAKHIFNQGMRYNSNFVAINCAALPGTLLESEIFGYEKGAFTGAQKTTRGKLELANNGTIFLDEIGDMPVELQAKLLRVLETKKFFRLGGEKEIEVDFRLMAATNQNLHENIKRGIFREDLYYRLAVIPIHIPPLRDRPDDIPAMIEYFTLNFCEDNELPVPKFTNRAIAFLSHLRWEGNARELENTIKRLIITGQPTIDIKDLPADVIEASDNFLNKALASELTLEAVSKIYVQMVLDLKNGNKKEACRLLDINYRTLIKKLKY